MLTLDNLTISQGEFRLVANLTLATGSRTAVIGPSGAGKSTLLGAIAGFIAPSAGRILWNETEITRTPPGARPLSILFQDQNLFPHLSVAQNIGLGISPALRLSRADHTRIEAALERTGLAGLGARKPAALSGGQQSRVALARALLRAKPLLLLDEPFSALGPALKSEMLSLVAEIAQEQGTTLLMVSHDPDDARALCPQTVPVENGTAHPPQPTDALLDNPPPALRAYLGP
ncbi:ATP-binding cassette domain-containing protein [Pseudothioclava nitratireducens]|uniref:thiamine ABC transporter ATP-binding protein n=1 Tax=Pseudothioclava nitratireducens TaxID=1928646 RepID=UPI0023D9CEC5|nr:ATP-binding cassette domain-containing protein [Defluviimonas nitratireducens]MDF1619111.1 ATP-binding cassette domain-containing protein [Defluviimonas nitratireducens]